MDKQRDNDCSAIFRNTYENYLLTARGMSDEHVAYKEHNLPRDELAVKTLAFYLPQFHPTKENDAFWHKGYTEWHSVTKAVPRYRGHYQPHLPADLGYYDLRLIEVMQEQARLAKNYGIFGFCFYHYWFNGRKLLNAPIENLLKNTQIDQPFCIFYANDSWARTWHGFSDSDSDDARILVQQAHNADDDIRFMQDTVRFFKDPRYITVAGRPLLLVYHLHLFPDMLATTDRWRRVCDEHGVAPPYLVQVQLPSEEKKDPALRGFDAQVQFSPLNVLNKALTPTLIDPAFAGHVYDYCAVIQQQKQLQAQFPLFRCVFPSWDNEARRPGSGTSYVNNSPERFADYFHAMCRCALENPVGGERMVFVNSWNEWAEGAHLEPDRKYGYAWLEAMASVLTALQHNRAERNG